MLKDLEIGQFRAFGFVVLKDCLRTDEVQRVQEAFDRVIGEYASHKYLRHGWDQEVGVV